jgi:hypothetical protein
MLDVVQVLLNDRMTHVPLPWASTADRELWVRFQCNCLLLACMAANPLLATVKRFRVASV